MKHMKSNSKLRTEEAEFNIQPAPLICDLLYRSASGLPKLEMEWREGDVGAAKFVKQNAKSQKKNVKARI